MADTTKEASAKYPVWDGKESTWKAFLKAFMAVTSSLKKYDAYMAQLEDDTAILGVLISCGHSQVRIS